MKMNNRWLRLGLAIICCLLILLLLPVLFSDGSSRTTVQRYVFVNSDEESSGQQDNADTAFDSSFFNEVKTSASAKQRDGAELSDNSITENGAINPEVSTISTTETVKVDIGNSNNDQLSRASVEVAPMSTADVGYKRNVAVEDTERVSKTRELAGEGSSELSHNKTTEVRSDATSADESQRWRVQLGSFSKASNAENLQKRLKQAGYVSVAKKSKDGRFIRVMAGAVDSREQALQLKYELENSIGIDGIVVYK